MYNFVITLTFTVARASAETTPSLYSQNLIDFMFAVKLIGSPLSNIGVLGLRTCSHDPGTAHCPGATHWPRVNFASVHGLTHVPVHMSFSLPRGNSERRVTRCTTPGNPPCRGNFSPCEQNAKVVPGARVVLHMVIIYVWNKSSNKKFHKAPEIGKRV